jgi:hypothetical protein
MNVIYSSNEFDIYKDERKNTLFTISYNNANNATLNNLFDSIIKTKIISNSTILKQKNEIKSIVLKASLIESFEQFKKRHSNINGSQVLPVNLIENLIYSLTKQISYLLQNHLKCFYQLETSNILVIDDCKFIYLSCEDLKDVKDDQMTIYRPISKTIGYISPELKNAKSIPILSSYKTIFYSLGLLILDCIKNSESIEITQNNNVLDTLVHIKNTKLYYFLKRSLSIEPIERFLLYV